MLDEMEPEEWRHWMALYKIEAEEETERQLEQTARSRMESVRREFPRR